MSQESATETQAGVARPGFFTIYKSGQGYWTRMLTAGGVALVTILFIHFLYTQIPIYLQPLLTPEDATQAQIVAAGSTARNVTIATCAVMFLLIAFLAWRIMNKPTNAEFLIATDSEMKKVNWTSRAELIGSTKVVIFFMFLIAFILFGIDILFGYLFYWFTILKNPPF